MRIVDGRAMESDLEIARRAEMRPITDVAESIGIEGYDDLQYMAPILRKWLGIV